jgi:hypothetical protein
MNRRIFIVTLPIVATALLPDRHAAAAQDVEYLQALERAQRDRPRVLTARGRIAPAAEPGTPLVIHGRVFRADGTTPARDMIVFAYHTDATGLYDVPPRVRIPGGCAAGSRQMRTVASSSQRSGPRLTPTVAPRRTCTSRSKAPAFRGNPQDCCSREIPCSPTPNESSLPRLEASGRFGQSKNERASST